MKMGEGGGKLKGKIPGGKIQDSLIGREKREDHKKKIRKGASNLHRPGQPGSEHRNGERQLCPRRTEGKEKSGGGGGHNHTMIRKRSRGGVGNHACSVLH